MYAPRVSPGAAPPPHRMKDALPAATRDLLALLDKLYPPRCIAPGESLADAHRYAGARELVDTLLAAAERDDKRATKLNLKVI
jgi:hypothetical protein